MDGKKALIGMSGGVDSSVVALLMLRAGYECIGATMRLYDIYTACKIAGFTPVAWVILLAVLLAALLLVALACLILHVQTGAVIRRSKSA